MVGHVDLSTVDSARRMSESLVLSMIEDMHILSARQASIRSILRYMIAAYNYSIENIVVGEMPYPDWLVPYLGSSYSQVDDSEDTPSAMIIAAHFRNSYNCTYAIRESWKLLPAGYLLINAYYSCTQGNDVLSLERLSRTIEYICTLCKYMMGDRGVKNMTLMSMGTTAKYVVSDVSRRLGSLRLSHDCIHAIQPVAYYRYMHLHDKIGIHEDYSCFRPKGIEFMHKLIQGYTIHAGIRIQDINMSPSAGISQLLNSSIKSLLVENEKIGSAIRAVKSSVGDTKDLTLATIVGIQEDTNTVLRQLMMILESNAFVTAVVMDNVVPAAATSTAATQDNTPIRTLTSITSAGILEGTSILTGSGMVGSNDDTSQVTTSVFDLLSPIVDRSVTGTQGAASVNGGISSLSVHKESLDATPTSGNPSADRVPKHRSKGAMVVSDAAMMNLTNIFEGIKTD